MLAAGKGRHHTAIKQAPFTQIALAFGFYPLGPQEKRLKTAEQALDQGAGLHRPALPGSGLSGSGSPHPHDLNCVLEPPCSVIQQNHTTCTLESAFILFTCIH